MAGLQGLHAALRIEPFVPRPPAEIPGALATAIGLPQAPVVMPAVREGVRWARDGVEGVELEWESGIGAPTRAWLLRPEGERSPLPRVLALHCHGGAKWFGKEKIADGPEGVPASVAAFRDRCYAGKPLATRIAAAGHAVLVPDAFGWGSRRVAIAEMPERTRKVGALVAVDALREPGAGTREEREYDAYSALHEDALAKELGVLGTSWAGLVAREDLVAADVLAARPEGVGAPTVLGFSGGGARSALVGALHPGLRGVAVMGMLASFPDLMAEHINRHTWIMMSPQIGLVSDWPNIVAARAPRPLFGGYALNDELFPLGGMQAADARLHELYSAAPAAYVAHWSDSAHACDELMQRALLEWLQNIAR